MGSNDWLKELKAGDQVLAYFYGESIPTLTEVSRVTKTLVVIGCFRFYKKSGRAYGIYDRGSLRQATPQAIASAQRKRQRRDALIRLRDVNWRQLDTDKLTAIVGILDTPTPEAGRDE